MAGPLSERFIIGRQGYQRIADLQGRLQGLDPQMDAVRMENDPESCAQIAVDLACEDRGIIFTIFDTKTQDFIAVVRERETREELLAEVRAGMERLLEAGYAADAAEQKAN